MIEITQSVDVENLTVTWKLKNLGPEHEMDGRVCHAIEESGGTLWFDGVLRALGYRYYCTVERTYSWSPKAVRTQYWERPLAAATSSSADDAAGGEVAG